MGDRKERSVRLVRFFQSFHLAQQHGRLTIPFAPLFTSCLQPARLRSTQHDPPSRPVQFALRRLRLRRVSSHPPSVRARRRRARDRHPLWQGNGSWRSAEGEKGRGGAGGGRPRREGRPVDGRGLLRPTLFPSNHSLALVTNVMTRLFSYSWGESQRAKKKVKS